jgi:CRP/FNR family transcriptional regulator, cyclic AMP receptor protein
MSGEAEVEPSPEAQLLRTPSALGELSAGEAEFIIGYTQQRQFKAGDTVIAEGDRERTDVMYLVVDGDVTVESVVVSRTEPIIVSVLGPGSLIGEMGLLDGAPRAASCVASSDVRALVLSREALARLILDDPLVGSKLLTAISQRMAERLRESSQKLRAYTQLVRAMQDEIERLDPTPPEYTQSKMGGLPDATPPAAT